MGSDKSLVAGILSLRDKNLSFFERVYPGIFNYFKAYQLQESKLDIQPQNNELDIIENQKHVYGGAKGYALKEVDHFLQHFDYGKNIHSMKPLYKGEYKNQRFFAQHIDRVYQYSSLTPETFTGYKLPDFFPLTVFMGCGLGLHIKALIEKRDLRHIVVAETNMDRFFSSFYAIDWEQLVTPYLVDNDSSFNFTLVPHAETEDQIRNVIWNQLIEYCPFFPVTTLFYNHLGCPKFDRIIDAINSDLYVHLFSFGNYDDEINQLNNAIHNFKQGIKRLPLPSKQGFDLPVCIVGSGPSLDERIEWLRSLQGKAIIVSCGTALRALYQHGIKPDFQVELESDYNTFATQSLNEDKEFMRSIKLIGAAQLSPLMFTLFDEKRVFFKGEGVLNKLFSLPGESIKEAAPTCTNAALAFAFHYGFSEIFLFGLDYGFPNKEKHHSAGAVYYKEDGPEGLKKATTYEESDLISVKAADGESILTTTFLFTSKRRTENIIQAANHPNIYNCSNGCQIDGAKWIDAAGFSAYKSNVYDLNKSDVMRELFNDTALTVSNDEIDNALNIMKTELILMMSVFNEFLIKPIEDKKTLMNICYQMNHWLQATLKSKNESFYFFVRGSVWHFLHAGFSHSFALEEAEGFNDFITGWQSEFTCFFSDILAHFEGIVFKEYDLNIDQMIHRSISQPENVTLDFEGEDMEWEYLGVSMQDNGQYVSYP
tara:strand:- start:206 stop:2335 length:2130 start_codon:yes stop_codon:yes gene_type:complete